MWSNSPFNLSFQRFEDKTNPNLCWQAKFTVCNEPFHKLADLLSFQIKIFQKPIMGALKSNFSRRTRISWFYSKILEEWYIWSRRLQNMLLEGFGDETNPKLCLQAEYVILRWLYSEKGHATGAQLEKRKKPAFWPKNATFDQKMLDFRVFELYTRSMSFFWISSTQNHIFRLQAKFWIGFISKTL